MSKFGYQNLGFGSGAPAAATTVTRQSDLVGWWKFNESSGTNAEDSSDNDNTAILTNGTFVSGGKNGKCVDLDGSDAWITIPSAVNAGTMPFTWSFWLQYETWDDNDALIADAAYPSGDGEFSIQFRSGGGGNGLILFVLYDAAANWSGVYYTNPSAPAGAGWRHYAITAVASNFTDATCDYDDDPTIAHDANANIVAGLAVSGTGIPAGATIASITDSTHFELSASTTGGAVTNGTLTFTGTNSQIELFINGTQATMDSSEDGRVDGNTYAFDAAFKTNPEMELGKERIHKDLDGQYDDFRIYDIQLTDDEIGDIYSSGNGDWPPS